MKKLFIAAAALAILLTLSACSQESSAEATHEHTYAAKVTKEPTCSIGGELTYTCECGYSYVKDIGANGHTITQVEAKAPTCEEPGCNAYEYCLECDYTTCVEIPATGHTWGGWITTVEPTDTAAGTEERICPVCNATETQEIPMLTTDVE